MTSGQHLVGNQFLLTLSIQHKTYPKVQVHFRLTKPFLLGYQYQGSSEPGRSFHQTLPTAQETDWIHCTKIVLLLEMQKDYEKTTYLEPVNQLQWLAVILVRFKDDICQFMYDHIQRALIFNGFGEVKLKESERNLLLIHGGCEVLVLATIQRVVATTKALFYMLPLFWYVTQIPDNLHFTECQKTLLRHLFLSSVDLIPWKSSEVTGKHPSFKHLPVLLHPEPTFLSSALLPGTYIYVQKEWANIDYHH